MVETLIRWHAAKTERNAARMRLTPRQQHRPQAVKVYSLAARIQSRPGAENTRLVALNLSSRQRE